jgi:hypothetical protein
MWAPQTKWYYLVDVHTHKLILEKPIMHTIHTGVNFFSRRSSKFLLVELRWCRPLSDDENRNRTPPYGSSNVTECAVTLLIGLILEAKLVASIIVCMQPPIDWVAVCLALQPVHADFTESSLSCNQRMLNSRFKREEDGDGGAATTHAHKFSGLDYLTQKWHYCCLIPQFQVVYAEMVSL